VIIMKGKILILLLMIVFLLASGCADKNAGTVPEDSNASATEANVTAQNESVSSGSGEDHIVRLEYYEVIRPSELDIQTGDTVSWWSGKRQGTYVLVSEEGLFPDEELAYSVPYSYTFNKPGTYLFTVKDVPKMNCTIRVN
jgi:plastocyanin